MAGCRAARREGGQGERRFFALTKLAKGALLDVEGLRKELTVEWPGMRISSPRSVVHYCLKSRIGTAYSNLVNQTLR